MCKRHCQASKEPSKSCSLVSKDPSQYFDGTRVYIQGSLWGGFAYILSEQQCLKKTGRFHCLSNFLIELYGTPKDLDDFCLESSAGGLDFP
ncbi:hypothetical protein CMV_019641 [Castanea mollissima]|uniref:Uncharacterized protein n=1 Tax=Castanea mollissima TaxID=60419 RepID=A0A8J4QMS9_9ROSI|nr:hypothetical protein CMV_019641 [Castanea mollissima]